MNREYMIRMLVDFSVEAAAGDPQSGWLRDIFAKGFRGFAAMSQAELLRELQYRDLAGFEDTIEDGEFEDGNEEPRIEGLLGQDRSRTFEDAGRD